MSTPRPYPWTAPVAALGDARFEEIGGKLACLTMLALAEAES